MKTISAFGIESNYNKVLFLHHHSFFNKLLSLTSLISPLSIYLSPLLTLFMYIFLSISLHISIRIFLGHPSSTCIHQSNYQRRGYGHRKINHNIFVNVACRYHLSYCYSLLFTLTQPIPLYFSTCFCLCLFLFISVYF